MSLSRIIPLTAISALVVLSVACGAATSNDSAGDENALRPQSQPDTFASNVAVDDGELAYALSEEGDAEAPPSDSQLGPSLDRKIIQSTTVDLEVEGENAVSRSFQDVIRIAETAGGFVSSSSFTNVDDKQYGDVTIRVPGTEYQSVLAQIRGMGTVTQEGSDANDVTEEYIDLEARLRTLNATEQRYLELLAQANNVNDILVVQDRLDTVRGQIEQVIGRMNLLDNLTDLATITVHLTPAVAVTGSSGDGGLTPVKALENAWQASLTVLMTIAIGVLVVAAFSWWLVPAVAIIAIAVRWWTNRGHRTPAGAPAP